MGYKGSADDSLIKKPHQKIRYTPKQVAELEKCMDRETGALYMMENYMYIQHPVKGRLRFEPFPYQVELTKSYNNHRFSINMCGRQLGKTTVAAGFLLWYAMFIPDSTILVAAHKNDGALEIMQRVKYAYESMPDHIRCGVIVYNKKSVEFDNGSRIIAQTTTETTGRGLSISLLYCDEFAFVPSGIAKAFWTSISPTLATGGKAIITSTPNSDDDQFAMLWKGANKKFDEHGNATEVGQNGFHPFMAIWNEHPDRDEQWAREEASRVGEEQFRREHMCEFIIYDETLINALYLVTMTASEPVSKTGQIRWYKKPTPGNTYIATLDPSLGTGGDNAAIQVYEYPSRDQVAEWYHNRTPIHGQLSALRSILKAVEEAVGNDNDLYWSLENNSIGEAALIVVEDTGEETFPGEFVSEPKKRGAMRRFRKGFNTTNTSKLLACSLLKTAVESDRLSISSKPLLAELKNFIASGASFAAKIGENDDLVCSLLLNIRVANTVKRYDDKVYDSMHQGIRDEDEDDPSLPMPMSFM